MMFWLVGLLFPLATWSYQTSVEGVRLRDQQLQRVLDCEPLLRGTKVEMKGERWVAGEKWVEVHVPKCGQSGLIKENQLAQEVKPRFFNADLGPNVHIPQEMHYLAGHAEKPPAEALAKSRGLYRFPLLEGTDHIGSCGSLHYLPDPGLVDTYIDKKAGCTFLEVLQEWYTTECPTTELGCRIAFGDISHKTKLRWNGHKTHLYGHCVDMRPLRKGEFKNQALWYQHKEYDQDATEKLIRLMRLKGATTLYFNDPVLIRKGLATRKGGHDNHIHVCFKNARRSDTVCGDHQFNANSCKNLAEGRMR